MRLEIIAKLPASRDCDGRGPHPAPLLFIHRMFHGAWRWDDDFLDYFVARGYRAYAVNLRGHGKSDAARKPRWTCVADFVDDLDVAVRQLPGPPIMIGHSLGGFIVQKYLEDHDLPGGVLLSSPPPAGTLRPALRMLCRRPGVFAKTRLLTWLRE